MAKTYNLLCIECEQYIWIGQSSSGGLAPYLYDTPRARHLMTAFLFQHQQGGSSFDQHSLSFREDNELPLDAEEVTLLSPGYDIETPHIAPLRAAHLEEDDSSSAPSSGERVGNGNLEAPIYEALEANDFSLWVYAVMKRERPEPQRGWVMLDNKRINSILSSN